MVDAKYINLTTIASFNDTHTTFSLPFWLPLPTHTLFSSDAEMGGEMLKFWRITYEPI
jgi:hypothetical protein